MDEENRECWAARAGALDNGMPFFTRFREDLPGESEIEKLNTLIIVSWIYESDNGNGLPPEDILEAMDHFENLMDDAIVEKGAAHLMTVFTGDGIREWQFYTDDEEIFMRKFNAAMVGQPVLPLEIEAFEDADWDAYQDLIRLGVKK